MTAVPRAASRAAAALQTSDPNAAPPPDRQGRLARHGRGLIAAGLRLGGALLQVLSAILVARMASPTQAGFFFIGFAGVTFGAVLFRAGFDQALTRFVAADFAVGEALAARFTVRHLFRRFLLRAAWAVPLLLGACVAVMLLPVAAAQAELATAMVPFILAMPFLGIAALAGVALQAAGRPVCSVLSMFFIHNLCLMSAAFLPEPWRDAGAFNFAFLLGCMIAAVFGAIKLSSTLRQRVAALPGKDLADADARRSEVNALARENAGSVIGNLILVWGPLGLVGLLCSPIDAARFGIAGRSAQLVSFALPALNFVLGPRFSALRATRRESELRSALLGSLMVSLALSSLIAIPMITFAQPIMAFFGPEYAMSAILLVLLASAQWGNGAAGAAIQFLAMTGSEVILRKIFVLTAAIAVLAGVPLVMFYQSTGAALLALGSSLLLNLLCTLAALQAIRRIVQTAPAPEPCAA